MKSYERTQWVAVWSALFCLSMPPMLPLSAQEPKLKKTVNADSGMVRAVAFSPDSKTLASGGDGKTIKLWNIAAGTHSTLFGHEATVTSVVFSPNGKLSLQGAMTRQSRCGMWKRVWNWRHSRGTQNRFTR